MWVAREPAVTKIFSPLITYSSPSSLAVVDTAAESEPKPGSVIAIAAQTLPSRCQLFVGGDAGDRRVAQALVGHRQQHRDVAPADLQSPCSTADMLAPLWFSFGPRRCRGTPRRRRTRSVFDSEMPSNRLASVSSSTG